MNQVHEFLVGSHPRVSSFDVVVGVECGATWVEIVVWT